MEKFTLFKTGQKQLNKSMRDLFKDLIDDSVEGPCEGYLKSIQSNYGYVFFWYVYPNNEALETHYANYVSRKKLKEIEKARTEDEDDTFLLQEYLEDCLFSIARDHSDTLDSGWADVYLAILMPDLEKKGAEEGMSLLKEFVQKLERLQKVMKNCYEERALIQDIEGNFEVVDFLSLKEMDELAD